MFVLLEAGGFDCQLYNAAQVKGLPGRPKIRGSFVAAAGQISWCRYYAPVRSANCLAVKPGRRAW